VAIKVKLTLKYKVTNFRHLPFPELKDYARKEIMLLKMFSNRPKSNIIQLIDSRENDDELVLVLEVRIYSIKYDSSAKVILKSFQQTISLWE
jgi:hypothetical protein